MTTVSIAMATYNGAPYLAAQLDSLLAQDRPPDEIVVCDDGSTDATPSILDRYAADVAIPIRVHRNPANLGYRANFMRAASLCASDLIFFCDQDDIWLPRKLTRMIACFDDPAVLLAYHNAALVDEAVVRYAAAYDDADQLRLLAQRPLAPWHHSLGFTQGFRRTLLAFDDLWPLSRDQNMPAPLAHDQWYILLALALGRVAYVPQELALYRQHGANVFGLAAAVRRPLRSRLAFPAEENTRLTEGARARGRVLAHVAERAGGEGAARARAAAARYEALARRLERRHATYSRPSFPARLVTFVGALRHGDYGGGECWTSRWAAAPRDLLSGVLAGSGR